MGTTANIERDQGRDSHRIQFRRVTEFRPRRPSEFRRRPALSRSVFVLPKNVTRPLAGGGGSYHFTTSSGIGAMSSNLTAKQQCFVDEYLIDLNATQAAIRAGYSRKNGDKIGPELLGKTRVAAAINKAKAARSERTNLDSDWVLTRLSPACRAGPTLPPMHRRRTERPSYSTNATPGPCGSTNP